MDKTALYSITHGVYIVGTKEDKTNRLTGCIVDAVMQSAFDPASVSLSTNKNSFTSECIRKNFELTLSILSTDADQSIITKFGFQTSRDPSVQKWDSVDYQLLGDLPVYRKAISALKLHVISVEDLGSHFVWNTKVVDSIVLGKGTPMSYAWYRQNCMNNVNTAKNIPDSNKVQSTTQTAPANGKKTIWVCGVCGYVYDGEIPFEQLPDDWKCPQCGMGKEVFEKKVSD